MRWPFVSRRAYEAVCADRERIRGERNQFEKDRNAARSSMRTAARKFADADAVNRRLMGRNLELGRRLSQLGEADPVHLASLEARLDRALAACARYLDALWTKQRLTGALQARLDDAVGLNDPAIDAAGRRWRHDHPNIPTTKETAS